MGPEPAPEYIRAELTSGGSIAKSSVIVRSLLDGVALSRLVAWEFS
jgi:hypothetical protein